MKHLQTIVGLIGYLIVTPIWYYLLYQVLVRVNASELMWFLFWVYIPAGIFVGLITILTRLNPPKP